MFKRRAPRQSKQLQRAQLAITLVIAATAPLALGGCTSDSPATDGPKLSVAIVQHRNDYAARIIAFAVSNDGDAPAHIFAIEYESDHFTEPLTYPLAGSDGATIEAGSTRDLRVPLAAVQCESDVETAATVTVRGESDGREFEFDLAASDPNDAIARIVAAECFAASVTAVATITPPAELRIEGSGTSQRAWLDISFTPGTEAASGAPLTLSTLHPTTLLDSPNGGGWPIGLTLDGEFAPRQLSIEIRPARCDPHAVAEDKRGTVLSFELARGGRYDVPVSAKVRAEIYDFVAAVCAYPSE